MAKCWTCGTHVSDYRYTCSSCESLNELKNLQKTVKSYGESIDYIAQIQQKGFEDIAQIQQKGFEALEALKDTLSAGLPEIASAIEWGFGEISWQLQQQTDVLRSIDYTLKTPSETKANEWRLHAEELRRRGVLEESEEFFLKALNEYRLDYRIYVGLAETYLHMGKFDKAKIFLEKSLPHAPKREIDYKSYSFRLIGHIYACEEDYNQATAILRYAIELSPNYEDGHYDYAQYCAQMRDKESCLFSLQKAILAKPLYWYLAQKERNFDPVRSNVEKLLSNIITDASNRAKDAIAKSENALKEAYEAVSKARQALSVSKEEATLYSSIMIKNAETKLKLAKDEVASGDYVACLKARAIAEESYALADEALKAAYSEREHYIEIYKKKSEEDKKRRAEKVKNAWKRVPLAFIGRPLQFGIIGAIGGCTVGIFVPGKGTTDAGFIAGFLIGILIAFIFGIYDIKKELE